ncbi:MAG TPA: endolytic transglycosylase MltG [Ignavibacteriales bacterium]|nr:endolytic transglycosylase MltG [Ignavibacteriales bacterium]
MQNNSSNSGKKKSLRDLLSRKEFIAVSAVFVITLVILIYTFFSPNYYRRPSPFTFEIRHGMTLSSTIDSLYSKGIIPSKMNMKIAAVVMGGGRNLKAGRYKIPNGLSYVGLMELFISGKREVSSLVTFYEGFSIYQFAHILKEKLHLDSLQVVKLCTSRPFLDSLGVDAPSLEGYLMPDSYYFYDKTPARQVIMRLRGEFNRFFTDSLKSRLRIMKYNLREVLTIASIVEGESAKISEYPVIAGVYYNRLKAGMKLQADPTVQYALLGRWRRLYNKDLLLDSRYNTYLYYGLPPGPINSPGRAAIMAALYPARHNYLYFVADGTGGHRFSSSFSEHQKLVRQYRAWRDKQAGK